MKPVEFVHYVDRKPHVHEVKHHPTTQDGTGYQVCDCGATRRVVCGQPKGDWHACALCAFGVPVKELKRMNKKVIAVSWRERGGIGVYWSRPLASMEEAEGLVDSLNKLTNVYDAQAREVDGDYYNHVRPCGTPEIR